jgi:predicted nucleotidyltransferase
MTKDEIANLSLPIELPMDAIRAFARKWGIVELALFGSVLRDDFNDDSDIDAMARFDSGSRHNLYDLVQMGDELEAIFGRKVDLLTRNSVENSPNYIRRKHILTTARVVYAE